MTERGRRVINWEIWMELHLKGRQQCETEQRRAVRTEQKSKDNLMCIRETWLVLTNKELFAAAI